MIQTGSGGWSPSPVPAGADAPDESAGGWEKPPSRSTFTTSRREDMVARIPTPVIVQPEAGFSRPVEAGNEGVEPRAAGPTDDYPRSAPLSCVRYREVPNRQDLRPKVPHRGGGGSRLGRSSRHGIGVRRGRTKVSRRESWRPDPELITRRTDRSARKLKLADPAQGLQLGPGDRLVP